MVNQTTIQMVNGLDILAWIFKTGLRMSSIGMASEILTICEPA